MDPLPHPPTSELNKIPTNKTICDNPHLFKIVFNININKFTELLTDHPNQPFMQSVIVGLSESFWPWEELQE